MLPNPLTGDPLNGDPLLPDHDLPPDDLKPVFDKGRETVPFSPGDALPMDDEGNILPGNDPADDDPNDNGDREGADPEDLPEGRGRLIDPNMGSTDLLP